MSLQIAGTGTREGMLKKVSAAVSAEKPPIGTDRAQMDAIGSLIAAEIGALPTEVNGVRIHAEASATPAGRVIQVQIFPVKIEV